MEGPSIAARGRWRSVSEKTMKPWAFIDRWFPNRMAWSRPTYAAWLLLLFLLLAAGPYSLINHIAAWRGVSVLDVQTSIDSAIPFVPWMFIFYASFYAYFPALFWVGAKQSRRLVAEQMNQRLIQATWVVFALFLLLPVEVELRHQIPAMDGVFGSLFASLHAADTPYNAWPSLHVLQSLLVILSLQTWLRQDGRLTPAALLVMWSAWALLTASTMMVKQHYVFDVVTGIVIGLLMWRAWFKPVFN